ncbi:MAG: SGNH/GDSL hydrolase family protein [Eisenbergiella sp.]
MRQRKVDRIPPGFPDSRLPRLYGKWKRKERYALSCMATAFHCGCDCSGLYGLEPKQPQWSELLMESLQDFYGVPIEFVNTSVGGVDTEWAIENAWERAASYQPDLVLLGFGMNDRCAGEEYRKKTRRLMERIREKAPETEFVLIATSLPNPLSETEPHYFCAHQHEYARSLRLLCGQGVVLADVQGVQREVMKRKRYIDLTGNLLNHPNDYLARIQAQVLDTVLKP